MISRYFYYDNLEPELRSAYDSFNNAISQFSQSAPINGAITDYESFSKVFMGVQLDHPEYAHFAGVRATVSDNNAHFPFLNIDSDLFNRKVNQIINTIYDSLAGKNDDYSKVKAIFDYLATHVKYDHDTYDKYRNAFNQQNEDAQERFATEQAYAFSAYSALVNGVAVCEGISKAFKLLCDVFSVPCMCILCSELVNGQKGAPHMVNRVTINGVDTYIDVTNSLYLDNLPLIRYNYFLASKEEMELANIFDDDYPGQCSEYNYFVRKNQRFYNAYSLRLFLASYDASANNREIRFRYCGTDLTEDEVGDLTREVLNRYAPSGKQWIVSYQHGFANGVLCDRFQVRKINEANKKLRQ